MMKHLLTYSATQFLLFIQIFCFSQDRAFQIYTGEGETTTYNDMLTDVSQSELLFFGELHDNAIAHWLELELVKSLDLEKGLILGMEMFEADNQEALNWYLNKEINQIELDSLARLWVNYQSDYSPIVDYAKDHEIDIVATNIPRRFANLVYKADDFNVLDTLSTKELEWVAPLPIDFDAELQSYQDILIELGDHASPALVKAQAIKDATMAYFILANSVGDKLFFHVNGSWHSDDYEGIVWYVRQEQPDLNIKTISVVTQSKVDELNEEHLGVADYIICVDEEIPGTY